jgi:hypothetical protein
MEILEPGRAVFAGCPESAAAMEKDRRYVERAVERIKLRTAELPFG